MKQEKSSNDAFDALLRDALASDAVPAGDFTERLMEQVCRTPQDRTTHTVPYRKLLAAVAACAVIAVAIPLVMSGGGSGSNTADCASADCASADCAAPMESNGSDGSELADEAITYTDQDAEDGYAADSTEAKSSGDSELPQGRETAHALTLTGQDARNAAATLEAMDIAPESTEADRVTYALTAEQAQTLSDTFDVLYAVEDDVVLVLIWEDAE